MKRERLSVVDVPASRPSTPLAPPLASRRAGTIAPRAALVPITDPHEDGRARIAARRVLRARGASWPTCRACSTSLAHVVQLDLADLPAPLTREPGIAQLFVCTEGCDTSNEHAPGVLVEVVGEDAVEVAAEVAARATVVDPGSIVSYQRIDESPGPDDREALGMPPRGEGDDADPAPIRCDKLGGYPAWEQGREVPTDDDGTPMELLFQLVEGDRREGGRPGHWDFDAARFVEGSAPTSVLDPNLPRHFASLLTGEAVGFLFRSPGRGRLAFRWQSG